MPTSTSSFRPAIAAGFLAAGAVAALAGCATTTDEDLATTQEALGACVVGSERTVADNHVACFGRSPDQNWWTVTSRQGGNAFFTYANGTVQENQGTWLLQVERTGSYHLQAFIPAAVENRTQHAHYRITQYQDIYAPLIRRSETVERDQSRVSDDWMDLGVWNLVDGDNVYITLEDDTGEPTSWYRRIAFDAIGVRDVTLDGFCDEMGQNPFAYDSHGEKCAWYSCGERWALRGTDSEAVCPWLCYDKSPGTCHGACAWYSTCSRCAPRGDREEQVCAPDAEVCPPIPSTGLVLEQDNACFERSPDSNWWEGSGHGGGSLWTYSMVSTKENRGRYNLQFATAGTYHLSVFIPNTVYYRSERAEYVIRAGGQQVSGRVNQALGQNSWLDLGSFEFAAGADQWVELSDFTGESGRRVVFDSLRIDRAPPCAAMAGTDSFCGYPARTPGCVATSPGGYCDPNGDGDYADADWDRGYYDYLCTFTDPAAAICS